MLREDGRGERKKKEGLGETTTSGVVMAGEVRSNWSQIISCLPCCCSTMDSLNFQRLLYHL